MKCKNPLIGFDIPKVGVNKKNSTKNKTIQSVPNRIGEYPETPPLYIRNGIGYW